MGLIDLTGSGSTLTANDVHMLPCTIGFNGTTNIKENFSPNPSDVEGEQTVSFRGRAMKGVQLSFEGLGGHLVADDNGDGNWIRKGAVESFSHWSRDSDPAVQTIGLKKLINEWQVITKQFASEVTEEDISKELASMK